MANVQLLKDTLAAIEAERARFNMGVWLATPEEEPLPATAPEDELCKTQMCLAGWTLLVAGNAKIGMVEREEWDSQSDEYVTQKYPAFISKYGNEIPEHVVPSRAAELLDFDDDAATVFYATEIQTVEGMRALLEDRLGVDLS